MDATVRSSPLLLPADRAAALIQGLGFVLVHDPRVPGQPPAIGSHLIVGMRTQPTLAHFDPERLTWWTTVDGRGTEVTFRAGDPPTSGAVVAWGIIRLRDRRAAVNEFVTFGGVVRTWPRDPDTTLVVIDSAAPILRRGGHSQDVDPEGPEVSAFFARLRAALETLAGAEERITATGVLGLYAAYVADLRERFDRARVLRDTYADIGEALDQEAHRLVASHPEAWDEGARLLDDLRLVAARREPAT